MIAMAQSDDWRRPAAGGKTLRLFCCRFGARLAAAMLAVLLLGTTAVACGKFSGPPVRGFTQLPRAISSFTTVAKSCWHRTGAAYVTAARSDKDVGDQDREGETAETSSESTRAGDSIDEPADDERADDERADDERADDERANEGGATAPADGGLHRGGKPTRLPIPEWVEQGSFLDGEDQVELVIGEPCPSHILATRDLEKEMSRRVIQVLDQWFGTGAGGLLGVDLDYIERELVVPQRMVVVPYDDANTQMLRREMGDPNQVFYRGFAQLRFTSDFRREALQRIEEMETRSRLMTLSRAVLIGLATLLAAFAFFRLNHVTRGFYTARLLSLIAVMFLLLLASIIGW